MENKVRYIIKAEKNHKTYYVTQGETFLFSFLSPSIVIFDTLEDAYAKMSELINIYPHYSYSILKMEEVEVDVEQIEKNVALNKLTAREKELLGLSGR